MKYTSILKGWKDFINEGISSEGTPDLKYYAFDWDDNIVFMPTEIMLLDNEGNEVGMSTHAFAKYREKIGKEEFPYEGKIIVGYADSPFRNFRVQGDAQFLRDILSAKLGPSFQDFKECVEGASLFSIITARGHTPSVLQEACRIYILSGFSGIETEKVISSIKKYNELYGTSNEMSPQELVDDYLKKCKFYPVSFGTGSEANPEKLKVEALKEFIDYVNEEAKRIRKHAVKGSKIQIGFSDDDKKNIETMITHFAGREPSGKFKKGGKQSLRIKYTGH